MVYIQYANARLTVQLIASYRTMSNGEVCVSTCAQNIAFARKASVSCVVLKVLNLIQPLTPISIPFNHLQSVGILALLGVALDLP